MSKIDTFPILISLRGCYKRLSQLTWAIDQIEKNYPLQGILPREKELLINEYLGKRSEIEEILADIKELEQELKNNE